MRISKLLLLSVWLSLASTIPTLAGWEQMKDGGWKYKDDSTGQYYSSGWQWIDSDGDGLSESYYFDIGGRLLTNTTTPDNYKVNENGAWIVDGTVQTKNVDEQPTKSIDTSEASSARQEETRAAFLSTYGEYLNKIASLAKENNHISVLNEMEKINYTKMVDALPSNEFCYMTDNSTGLKIRPDYLYYGSLTDGIANGSGNMYITYSKFSKCTFRYGYFVGEWKDDAPNGKGEEHFYSNNSPNKIHNIGNYVNWYQDGDMTSIYYDNEQALQNTYKYKVIDKLPVGIDKKVNGRKEVCTVVAYPEENKSRAYLTFYDTAQSVLHYNLHDGNLANAYGYWRTR